MKRHFDDDLAHLRELMLRMGAMAEDAISQSIRALVERDSAIAERVIALDDEIDRLELEADRLTMELIAKMQPAASDLRTVVTAMRITPELERIADLAQYVCERAIELNGEAPLKPLVVIPRLARITQEVVRQSIDGFV
jgi:phosphate transport system protein